MPTLLLVDKANRLIYMERIPGITMKAWLYWTSGDAANKEKVTAPQEILGEMSAVGINHDELARRTGISIAKLHKANLIHGDLTTSNFLLRSKDLSVVVIDFGLSYTSTMAEDRAVDLYVLERAFLSTHTEMTDFVRAP